eukprot:UN21935
MKIVHNLDPCRLHDKRRCLWSNQER